MLRLCNGQHSYAASECGGFNMENQTMRKLFIASLIASLVAGGILSTTPQAFAQGRRVQVIEQQCAPASPIGQLAVLGLLLGAVTGGVGSAVAYGGAYAVGGAAIGGSGGFLLGAVHEHGHCS